MSFGEYLGASLRNSNIPQTDKILGNRRGKLIKAVGCKVMYDYFADIRLEAALRYLQKANDLHVIHLTRENMLESYVSLIQARFNGEWTKSAGTSPVELDPGECITYFKSIEEARKSSIRYFASKPVLHVTYEDLVKEKEQTLREVTEFLKVKNHPMHSVLQVQREGTLSERIMNYEEVARALTGTKWEPFLNAPLPQKNR
jgi:LPS sulfotransferase NodH